MRRVQKLSALRREDARDGDSKDTLVVAAHSLSLSSHPRLPHSESPSYISLPPHDNTGCPPPRSLDNVPTSAPISVSASTSIALQADTFTFLPLLFALRFVVSFPSSFLPFFPRSCGL
jgi:hypothetical protein